MRFAGYDHLVVGAGALGAATAYWLSKINPGARIAVCDQFQPGHPWGSSDDHSRIIRHAYHSADYTALTPAMFDTWHEVEREAATQLVLHTGGLDLAEPGTPGADVLAKYCQSMDAHNIPYRRLDAAQLRARWPQWHVSDDVLAVHQAEAGLVDIRRATATHLALAREAGVEVLGGRRVLGISETSSGCTVETSEGTMTASTVALCAGSWAQPLLNDLGVDLPLELSQEQVQYFTPSDPEAFDPSRFPIWIWHGEADYYGFPVYGEPAIKAARDMSGRFVTQETRSFDPLLEETELIHEFLLERLPAAAGPLLTAKTCVYDLPRDRELVFGPLPGSERLQVAIGAGHAGKFASLIGRVLADIAATGGTLHPIAPFDPGRASLRTDAPARYRLGEVAV